MLTITTPKCYLCRAFVTTLLLVLSEQTALAQDPPNLTISTLQDVTEGFSSVPCKNKERLKAVQALFEKMGADAADISIQRSRGTENLIVTKHGRSEDTVVIGAHYDLSEKGCGAIDNWSGIVAIAHLYRTIRPFDNEKTILFVAFGKEEEGLFGSKAMVDAIPKSALPRYCAMLNIDSFGLAGPFALEHVSSPKLMELASEAAEVLQLPFYKASLKGTDADSSSFLKRDIPAVTLSGISRDWENVLHTDKDQVSRVLPPSVYLGYRLALLMWTRIDQATCTAFKGKGPSRR